jgi:hypothetical protein
MVHTILPCINTIIITKFTVKLVLANARPSEGQPAKQVEAKSGSNGYGEAEKNVACHKDEHQTQTEEHLDCVQH